MRVSFLIAGVLLAIGLIFAINYRTELLGLMGFDAEATEPAVTHAEPPAAPPPAGQAVILEPAAPPLDQPQPATLPPPEPLPALAQSDDYVRQQLTDWSLPPGWLQREELVARASSILSNAAAGQVPHRQLSFLVPARKFPVTRIGETYYWDRTAASRYDVYVQAITQVPAARAADVFKAMAPLFDQALAQLGERRSAVELLVASINTLQVKIDGLPALPAQVELRRPNVIYEFADPSLEELPELDKLLLRIGVDNVSRINVYLSELEAHF